MSEEKLLESVYELIDYVVQYPDAGMSHSQTKVLDMLRSLQFHIEENQELESA